jgi:hypothetical protein
MSTLKSGGQRPSRAVLRPIKPTCDHAFTSYTTPPTGASKESKNSARLWPATFEHDGETHRTDDRWTISATGGDS